MKEEQRVVRRKKGKEMMRVGLIGYGAMSRQVLERLEIFSEGGGFVFNTVHNILPDVPPENVLTMYDAVKEFNSR